MPKTLFQVMPKVLVMVLAGGEGTRLHPLTQDRAKPAVPFGGKYRIIDFVLSNLVNSQLYRTKLLTQYKSDSLNRHISRGWRLSAKLGHYIENIPAQMRLGKEWFKGSADAIYQSMQNITNENPDIVLVFGADHIYKMDIRQFLQHHLERESECTIAAIPFPIEHASNFGVIEVDKDWRVVGFEEKPKNPKPMPGDPDHAMVSMGNYIFDVETLISEVRRDAETDSAHDFGKSIIPTIFKSRRVYVYDFNTNIVPGMSERERGYWRDVGDLDTYWETSMDLVSVSPALDIHNPHWPIHSDNPPAPPAKFVFADEKTKRIGIATDSIVSDGCIISGGHINRSILSPYVRINSYSHVTESVLFEGVNVGRYAMIRRAIIDKHVDIPPGIQIGYDIEADKKNFHVTPSGVVVIPKGTIIE